MPPRRKPVRRSKHVPVPGPSTWDKPEEKPRAASSGRFLKLLQARELGVVQDFSFPAETIRNKLCDFRRVRTQRFGNEDERLHTVYFVRAGRNSLIGVWYVQIRSVFTTAVAQIHFDLSKVVYGQTAYIDARSRVFDACQVYDSPDCFLCTTADEVIIATPESEDNYELVVFSYTHPENKYFWSCDANFFSRKFALGCDKEICLYNVAGLQDQKPVRINVHGLAYNNCGTLLHMTGDRGEFGVFDIRTGRTSLNMRPDETMLDDVCLLSDENFCLVSGISGKLMKLDLRNKKKVLDYPYHERRSRKIPVSVNERYSAVSCTGSDERTRVWCLKTGELLQSFPPPTTFPARSCLVTGSSRCLIQLIQDHYVHVYSFLK